MTKASKRINLRPGTRVTFFQARPSRLKANVPMLPPRHPKAQSSYQYNLKLAVTPLIGRTPISNPAGRNALGYFCRSEGLSAGKMLAIAASFSGIIPTSVAVLSTSSLRPLDLVLPDLAIGQSRVEQVVEPKTSAPGFSSFIERHVEPASRMIW
jgi:hypothetical protein